MAVKKGRKSMEKPLKGSIVVVGFPFSDLSSTKKRPALVICSLRGDDLILSQITSAGTKDSYSIKLSEIDFEQGSLRQESNVRPNKLFTADSSIILYKIGSISAKKLDEIIEKICKIIKE
ncbi:MAG: type II toxin-antitoxin system PemK/MazF family toxin [archaeon]